MENRKFRSIAFMEIVVILIFSFIHLNNQGQGNLNVSVTKVNKPDTTDLTNYFYDNAETHDLKVTNLFIGGEITNPGQMSFEGLRLHSVIVKETLLSETGDRFVGAYRYDGYSLLNILNNRKLEKKNKEEFPPIIDMYVQVENERGEKVNISWGEIYYPNHLHEIIIATRVMRIVPSKTKDLWPLPTESKLVFGTDLITERNISSPSKITVLSYPKSFVTVKGMSPVFSPDIKVYKNDELVVTLNKIPENIQQESYHTIFYGRGRGIHSTQPFEGYMLKEVLKPFVQVNRDFLRLGLVLMAAKDGYRGVFTFSEIFNRNDQSETLLIYVPDEKDGGAFRLFPAGDFFSDRAIKAVESIYIFGR
jgi:hypothetical protein